MKLISCHIENFGKISDFRYDFSEGTNVIREDNGWGKSTFAAFIRSMFYGLEGDGKRKNITEKERVFYKPWQGGTFGGQLVFEKDGKTYQITRIFGDKEANDTFELRDHSTNMIVDDFSAKIGEEIFEIGRESFMNTVFIGQSQCRTSSTDDINAKMGNLLDGAEDLNRFEVVNARVEEMKNKLTPQRKTGSIKNRASVITEYKQKVKTGDSIEKSLAEYTSMMEKEREQYNTCKKEREKKTAEVDKISKAQGSLSKKKEWEKLKASVAESEEKLLSANARFPKDIVKKDDIDQMLEVCSVYGEAIVERRNYALSDEQKKAYDELTYTFDNGMPDQAELVKMIEDSSKLSNLIKEQSANQVSEEDQRRYEELERAYGQDDTSVSAMISKWNERCTKKTSLSSAKATLSSIEMSEASRKEEKKLNPLPIVIGLILILVGLGLLLKVSTIIGIIVMVFGVIVAAVTFVMPGKGKPKEVKESEQIVDLRRSIEADEAYIHQVDEEVAGYLSAHGKTYDENAVSVYLQNMMEEKIRFDGLKERVTRAKGSDQSEEIQAVKNSIEEFLRAYGVGSVEDYANALYGLKDKCDQYKRLDERFEKFSEATKKAEIEKGKMDDFLNQYGFEISSSMDMTDDEIEKIAGSKAKTADEYKKILHQIREDVVNQMHLSSNCQAEKAKLAAFEEENDTDALSKVEAVDGEGSDDAIDAKNEEIDRIIDQMEVHQKNITSYDKTITNLMSQHEEWEEDKAKLDELEQLQEEERLKYNRICKVQEKLTAAKLTMTKEYSKPLMDAFGTYYQSITGVDSEKYFMDANINVTVEEEGLQRELATLSAGYQDLVGICLRVAFADAMYPDEKPMLILDDPFTNLDDKKMKCAKGFLDEVAKKYQVIYFTCSESRE